MKMKCSNCGEVYYDEHVCKKKEVKKLQINKDSLEGLYIGVHKECIETIAIIMCSSLAEEYKESKVEEILIKYDVIK
jgi:ribosomal protein L32